MKEIKLNKLNETIYYDVCDNGLEIYMWVNEKSNNYLATLNVRYGSVDTLFKLPRSNKEIKVPNGVAHFLEHIEFNESNGSTAHDYFNKVGSSTNAFTTFDFTSYEVYGSNDIKGDISHLLDFVQDKAINEDLVNKEKGIIIEEEKMGDNNPGKIFFFEGNNILYHTNKRKNLVTGTIEDIKSISVDDLNTVFDNFYVPNNMILVITGNFNPYEIAALVKENQINKKIKSKTLPKVIKEKEDKSVVCNYKEIEGNIEIPKLKIMYKIPRSVFKDIDDIDLGIYLSIILNANFGATSDFREELLEKELISALSFNYENDNSNMIILTIDCESKYPNELIKLIKENMKKLKVSDDRLRRRIKCNIANIITGFDSIEYINYEIVNDLIFNNKVISDIYNRYKNLNIDELNKIIKRIDLDNVAVLVFKPKKVNSKEN